MSKVAHNEKQKTKRRLTTMEGWTTAFPQVMLAWKSKKDVMVLFDYTAPYFLYFHPFVLDF